MLFIIDGKIYDSQKTTLGVLFTDYDLVRLRELSSKNNCYFVTPGEVAQGKLNKMVEDLRAANKKRNRSESEGDK